MATKHSNGNGRAGRAVLYLRMSSDQQTESIPQQRQALIEYASRQGYKIVGEFSDAGISGDATERRTGFLEMRDAAERGEFGTVLSWDADRIGRWDILDGGFWLRPFRQAGIVFETIGQGRVDLEDLTGQLVYSVTQMGKHQFLRDLSRNVTRGALAAAQGHPFRHRRRRSYTIRLRHTPGRDGRG